ncbi:bifunctional PLP-dependent enzyme with beta-cystathionase and maltose regulon repressor activities [Prevotella dentalis DSM 3688]|uniref:cysteine-S-conjugate beta-lyase n=1 Tax=Prevotella dentalis (strain ATCC 49559 / DSM 3688 / JCM 13448 / NCTC 12043 / ES 2772) TaxID=908937 RepID=F9D162_PREDD|nr:MalY/PatB family protein [Prevotella dentalis]AGB27579.1 bifunctional PLP-dependent enzyme with beta-cystathionase and maltose regulon repressor activities [Prevotella dentalis DSM 3688]EGQ16741.1 cystathionine beta-lyase [Prevotella dentalis DSM 3688]
MATQPFDQIINRRHTGSYKWDSIPEDALPLWVADMDFQAAPPIRRALAERVAHGVFGYTQIDESYYEAIISWFHRRHQWDIRRDWILYTSGVVPAISCCIKALTLLGERVLVQTPVYNCFFSCIRNQGCELAENELHREGDSYSIDWDDFESKCSDEKTTVFLLCNPHNPAGRVWTREELERMGTICARHHVHVISDEIHCELIMPGHTFTPFAAVNSRNRDICITLNSPSKSFNTAGLQIANIVCSDSETRRRIDRVINIYEVCDVNPFGPVALKAAYNESEDWLDALNAYIHVNYETLKHFLANRLPQLRPVRLEGTYLAWVDISALGLTSDEAAKRLLHEGKVLVSSGTLYGQKAGEGYLRINLACPRELLHQGLKHMAEVFATK